MHCELAGKTPKKDWHVNKAIQHMQNNDGWFKGFQTQTNTNPDMEARAWLQGLQLDPKSPLFSGLTNLINKQRNNGKFLDDLKYLFIYDTGSNVTPATISNPDFAMKI
jgi:hypothetical protein